MAFVLALVARGTAVLAERAVSDAEQGGEIAREVLAVLAERSDEDEEDEDDGRASYLRFERGDKTVHVLVSPEAGGLAYLCVCDAGFSRTRVPLAFLEAVMEAFTSAHVLEAPLASPGAFDASFGPVLEAKMTRFESDPPEVDVISRVRGELSEVKRVMVSNIERALDRGDALEHLVDKTEHLRADALKFRTAARSVRKRSARQIVLVAVAVVAFLLLVAYFIAAQFCDYDLQGCGRK